jgi:hypothetical protein
VPGVIAFAVDFATGAIYLPPEQSPEGPKLGADLRGVRVEPAELTARQVEAIVSEQTGKAINLTEGEYRAVRLQSLDELTPATVAGLRAGDGAPAVKFRASDE